MKKYILIIASFAILLTMLSACKKVSVDGEIMDAIKATSENCEVDLRYSFVKNCKAGELTNLQKLIKDKGPTHSLSTVSAALNDSDEKVRAVACKLLYREIRDNIGNIDKNKDKLPAAVAEHLIEGMSKIDTYVVFYAAQLTTHVAMMKGVEDKLYAMLKDHPIPQVRYESYAYLMTYGRLRAFDKVKELMKGPFGDDKWLPYHISSAPGNMYKWTDDEKNAICPWLKEQMNNENESVQEKAARTISGRCGGEYIDAFLDEAEKRANEGNLKSPFSKALSAVSCESFFGSQPIATEKQCDRATMLKGKVAK
jgi:hypothetical protein